MILHQDDWLKYPNAIVDYKTKNKSWRDIVVTLHEMGVKNCLFPLALHDQSLQGVDPHSPNLTEDQKIRICLEIETNPWYYLREVVRIEESGTDGNPLLANRAVIAIWWNRLQSIDVYVMQPRQSGKSIIADCDHVWKTIFYGYKMQRFLLTKDSQLVAKNTMRLKKLRAMLPKYTWYPTKKDKDVEHIFNYAARENELTLRPAQTDETSAINAARGFTVSELHVDEVPFIKYIQVMLPAISSAMDNAIWNAKKNGVIHGKLFTTTAGDLSIPQGRYAYELFCSGCTFTEEMYDLGSTEKLRNVIIKNTGNPNPMVSMVFNHRMLGISDEEFWRRIRGSISTEEDINKDYFLIWGKGGVQSIIPTKTMDRISQAVIRPKYNELTSFGYVMRWYLDKDVIESYMNENNIIMGVDTSEQINRDSTAFILFNPVNLEMVATLNVSDANLINTANWLASFMIKYKNITMIIEKKSSAQSFIDAVLDVFIKEGVNPFKRIWNQIVDNNTKYKKEYDSVKRNFVSVPFIQQHRRLFGFNTSGNTRHLLYSQVIQMAASRSAEVLRDEQLANQLASLKVSNDGRVDHASSGHDDAVMAWLLGHWMLMFGRNLDFYGIDSRYVMRNVNDEGKQLTEEDLFDMSIVDDLEEEIEELISVIRREKHPSLLERHIHRFDLLNRKLNKYGIEPKTIDGIIIKGREDKLSRQLAKKR